MSIIQLTDKNFYLAGRQTKTLNISVDGNLLVLFKMSACPACAQFEPIFYQLSQKDNRIRYAVCDISQHQNVTRLSQLTNYPIKAVPWIFLYSGGFPVARFKGKRNAPSVQAFVGKALQEVQNRQRRSQRSFVPQQPGTVNYPQNNTQRSQYPNQPQQQPKYWKPDMDKTPSMRGVLKGGAESSQYSYLGEGLGEDDDKAKLPEDVTPHNMPWGSGYKRMGTLD